MPNPAEVVRVRRRMPEAKAGHTRLFPYIDLGGTRLMFMQSNGGLVDARFFQGKDSILSGPAGGIVGAVRTSTMAGFDRIIDVSPVAG